MSKPFLIKAGSIVGSGGLIFDRCNINNHYIYEGSIAMTSLEEGWVIGIIGAGSVVGALMEDLYAMTLVVGRLFSSKIYSFVEA